MDRKRLGSLLVAGMVWGALPVFAKPSKVLLVPFSGGTLGQWGYRSRETQKVIIPNQFEQAQPFSEGLAGVRIQGRWGYINRSGKVVIPPRFEDVGRFHAGLAAVQWKGRVGAINRKGKPVLKGKFTQAYPFTSQVLFARIEEPVGGLAQDPETLLGLQTGWGLYHLEKGWLTKEGLRLSLLDPSLESGLIWASTGSRRAPYGLLRADGTWQVKPKYSQVQRLSNGRALVTVGSGDSKKMGAVDPTGKLVVALRPGHFSYFRNGVAPLKKDGKVGLVDLKGNLIGGRTFEDVEIPETGDAFKVKVAGVWEGLSRSGNSVASPDDGEGIASCPSGIQLVRKSGKVQVQDGQGQPTVPYLFDYTYNKLRCDQPSSIRRNGTWTYLGLDGRVLNDSLVFENIYGFKDGYGAVMMDGKWRILDSKGQFVLADSFDKIQLLGQGLFGVQKGKRAYRIDATGKEVKIPPKDTSVVLACAGGGRIIELNGKWGIATQDGSLLIKPKYRAIHCFEDGLAWAAFDSRKKWCPLDPSGSLQENPGCESVRYPPYTIPTHHQPEVLDEDPYESSVLWTLGRLEYGLGKRKSPPRLISDFILGR